MTHRRMLGAFLLASVGMALIASAPAHAERSKYFDPATMIGLEEIHQGMLGTCRTTFSGTAPTEFQIEVIQVIRDLYPGLDYVLFRMLDGQCVERKSGVVGGMSGSPVFFDGRLAGALSRGPAPIQQPLAMFTPIEYMLETLDKMDAGEPGAQASGVRTAQLDEPLVIDGRPRDLAVLCDRADQAPAELRDRAVVFTPCTPTLTVTGVPDRVFPLVKKLFSARGLQVQQGIGGASDAPAYPLVPGCPIGASMMTGDIAMGSPGTLTWTDGKRFLAFGHGMSDCGPTNQPATYHEILEVLDFEAGRAEKWDQMLKVAPAGTVVRDDLNAVGGVIGQPASMFPLEIRVTDTDTAKTRTYHSQVTRDKQYAPVMPAMATLSVLEPWIETVQDYVIKGELTVVGETGRTIRTKVFDHTDAGPTMTAGFQVLQSISMLMTNVFSPEQVQSVSIDFQVSHAKALAMLEKIELDDWAVQTGTTVPVRLTYRLQDGLGTRTETIEVPIPADLPSGQTTIVVGAGPGIEAAEAQLGFSRPEPVDLDGLIEMATASMIPNNHVAVIVGWPGQAFLAGGRSYPNIPADIAKILSQAGTTDYATSSMVVRTEVETDLDVVGLLQHPLAIYRPEEKAAASQGGAMAVGSRLPEMTPALAEQTERAITQAAISKLSRYLTCGQPMLDTMLALEPGIPFARLSETRTGGIAEALGAYPALWSLFLQGPPSPGLHMPEGVEPGKVKPVKQTDGAPAEEATEPTEGAPTEADEGETEDESAKVEAIPVREPKTVLHNSPETFRGGELAGVSLASTTGVTLAAKSAPVHRFLPDALYAWDVAPDGKGGVFIGTGPKGIVYRVGADGAVSEFFRTDDAQVFALYAMPDGSLIVGTGPSGKLYHISATGKEQGCVETGEAYVWDMDWVGDSMLVATGPNGRLLRLTPGKVAPVADLRDDHILSVTAAPDGAAYLGTDGGLIYKVAADGYVHGLGKSPLGPVSSMATSSDGTVWFGSVGNAYRITPGGQFEVAISTPDMGGYALASVGESVFLGCSQVSRVYAADTAKSVSEFGVLDDPEATVTALCAETDGSALWTLTTAPVSVYRMPIAGSKTGTYTSAVLDATTASDWLALRTRAEVPAEALVGIRTRTGATAIPGDDWSLWTDAVAGDDGAWRVTSPTGQYFQYELTLTSQSPAAVPSVATVEATYLALNLPPTVGYADPSKVRAVSEKAELSWEGSDPNEDTLRYTVSASSDRGLTWQTLSEGKTETSFSWDVTEVEEGAWIVRVVGSDAAANPGRGLEDEVVIGPVLVDRTAPKVLVGASGLTVEGTTVRVSGAISDKTSGVKVAQYRIDDAEVWLPVAPDDLRYDSGLELVTLVLEGVAPGDHVLEIVAFDGAGNQSTVSVPFTIEGEPAQG